MKKSENWKREYGMIEASKKEIAYFESYPNTVIESSSLEELIAKSKKKNSESKMRLHK